MRGLRLNVQISFYPVLVVMGKFSQTWMMNISRCCQEFEITVFYYIIPSYFHIYLLLYPLCMFCIESFIWFRVIIS